jgi:hypothetical protein
MDAANGSQGLKVAVAALVNVTLILAVVSYFLYSEGSTAKVRLASQQDGHRKAKDSGTKAVRALVLASMHNDEMRA